MVSAELSQSVSGVEAAFDNMDMQAIAVTGAIAAFGMSVALAAGLSVTKLLGVTPGTQTRSDYAVTAIGALFAGVAFARFVPGELSKAASVGAMVAVGMAVLGVLVGPFSSLPFRDPGSIIGTAADAPDLSGGLPNPVSTLSSGCASCGSVSAEGPIRAVEQGKAAEHFR